MSVKWLREAQEEFSQSSQSYAHELRMSLAELVIDRLRELGWSQKDICAKLAVSEPLVSRLLNGDHNWTSESAGKLLWALGVRARIKPTGRKTIAAIEIPEELFNWPSQDFAMASEDGQFIYRGNHGEESCFQLKDFSKEAHQARKTGNHLATGFA